MAIRQTRIYAPAKAPYDSQFWAETMMARIIKPLVEQCSEISWFWFTRYASEEQDFADSNGDAAPPAFFDHNNFRSLRFRFEVADSAIAVFENCGNELISREGCWNADWREYGISELCSNRFIGEERSNDRRKQRLVIVRDYVVSVSRLALHALVAADNQGRFRFEHNDDLENPHDSAFFSLHHLFCNPTEVILTALITNENGGIQWGTRQYPPEPLKNDKGKPFFEGKIRF